MCSLAVVLAALAAGKAATSGFTCRNRDGHGFFLSLNSGRTFWEPSHHTRPPSGVDAS